MCMCRSCVAPALSSSAFSLRPMRQYLIVYALHAEAGQEAKATWCQKKVSCDPRHLLGFCMRYSNTFFTTTTDTSAPSCSCRRHLPPLATFKATHHLPQHLRTNGRSIVSGTAQRTHNDPPKLEFPLSYGTHPYTIIGSEEAARRLPPILPMITTQQLKQ